MGRPSCVAGMSVTAPKTTGHQLRRHRRRGLNDGCLERPCCFCVLLWPWEKLRGLVFVGGYGIVPRGILPRTGGMAFRNAVFLPTMIREDTQSNRPATMVSSPELPCRSQ